MEIMLAGLLVAVSVGLVLQVLLLVRRPQVDLSPLDSRFEALERAQERGERVVRDELSQNREEFGKQIESTREVIDRTLKQMSDSLLKMLSESSSAQGMQLDAFTERVDKKLDAMRQEVDRKLGDIQKDNTAKLEQMRQTVDEKLEGTLEKRLGESFKQVSERLEQVHKGLGEMQSLANGVGDLKKVLSNVKTRGTWGEVQLGNLLDQVLAPGQYAQNVATNPATDARVEYAIKLPGQGASVDSPVWLPIDAKFPQEDYLRLMEAADLADAAGIEQASKQLARSVRDSAKTIHQKYVNPPSTTDFAVMFLPTEGLYAEVLRQTELVAQVQRESRVVIAGPTTLAALLNSLQMGFRTLAIQQRSSEVWEVLGAVKGEFSKFQAVMKKVDKKLTEAKNVVATVSVRTRAMDRKLRSVEQLDDDAQGSIFGELPEEFDSE